MRIVFFFLFLGLTVTACAQPDETERHAFSAWDGHFAALPVGSSP